VIVATVGASLSLIVPVAEAVPEQCWFRYFINVSAVVFTDHVPVVAPGTLTV
jgi:hypothetical protein